MTCEHCHDTGRMPLPSLGKPLSHPCPYCAEEAAQQHSGDWPERLRRIANTLDAGGEPMQSTPTFLRSVADLLASPPSNSETEGDKR